MTERRLPPMTADELEHLVRKAVRDELSDAGLRVDDIDHQFEARQDFLFLRKMRRAFDGAASKIGYTVLSVIVLGLLGLVWTGFQHIFPSK